MCCCHQRWFVDEKRTFTCLVYLGHGRQCVHNTFLFRCSPHSEISQLRQPQGFASCTSPASTPPSTLLRLPLPCDAHLRKAPATASTSSRCVVPRSVPPAPPLPALLPPPRVPDLSTGHNAIRRRTVKHALPPSTAPPLQICRSARDFTQCRRCDGSGHFLAQSPTFRHLHRCDAMCFIASCLLTSGSPSRGDVQLSSPPISLWVRPCNPRACEHQLSQNQLIMTRPMN